MDQVVTAAGALQAQIGPRPVSRDAGGGRGREFDVQLNADRPVKQAASTETHGAAAGKSTASPTGEAATTDEAEDESSDDLPDDVAEMAVSEAATAAVEQRPVGGFSGYESDGGNGDGSAIWASEDTNDSLSEFVELGGDEDAVSSVTTPVGFAMDDADVGGPAGIAGAKGLALSASPAGLQTAIRLDRDMRHHGLASGAPDAEVEPRLGFVPAASNETSVWMQVMGKTTEQSLLAMNEKAKLTAVASGAGLVQQAGAPLPVTLPFSQTSQATAAPVGLPAPPAFLPVPAHRQVTDAVLQMHDDRIEIALSPEELGSVRLVLSRSEAGPTLTVWVERPEVLEMMRRSADTMLADLRGSGLADTNLDFRSGSDLAGRDNRQEEQGGQSRTIGIAGGLGDETARGLPLRPAYRGIDGGRLDIRV